MEVSKTADFYVIEVKDEMRVYNLKKARRNEDEKIYYNDRRVTVDAYGGNGKR